MAQKINVAAKILHNYGLMSHPEFPIGHFPKLPKLDKEDVKAVRGFLPGKLLGRTAAFLSLVLLVLVFVKAADLGLKQLLGTEDRAKFRPADRAQDKAPDWIERFAFIPLYLTGIRDRVRVHS